MILALGAALLIGIGLALLFPFGEQPVRREASAPRAPDERPEGRVRTVFFPACDGTRLEGWLFTPRGEGRAPLVVMAPGLTGTKEGPRRALRVALRARRTLAS